MKMSDNKISSLVVFDKDNHKPIGIVTERDLVRKVCVIGISSGDISIKDVMSASTLVAIDWRLSIEVAADMMIQDKVRRASRHYSEILIILSLYPSLWALTLSSYQRLFQEFHF